MTVIDIFAGVAYLITDVVVVLSLVGSIIIAIAGFVEYAMKRRIELPEQVLMWGFGGVVFGFVGLFLTMITEYSDKPIGFVFQMSRPVAGGLLAISLILLILRTVLRRNLQMPEPEYGRNNRKR